VSTEVVAIQVEMGRLQRKRSGVAEFSEVPEFEIGDVHGRYSSCYSNVTFGHSMPKIASAEYPDSSICSCLLLRDIADRLSESHPKIV
jgi:hypothetical protein